MKYLKTTKSIKIIYNKEERGGDLIIKGYSNFDWAGNYAIRKPISGFVFMLNGGSVS